MAARLDPSLSKICRALRGLGRGAATALAVQCRVRRQNITRWQKTGQVPAHHCLAVEQLTGISRHELRPDVFGTPEQASLARAG